MRDIRGRSRLVPDWLRIGAEGLSSGARVFRATQATKPFVSPPLSCLGLAKRATRRFSTGGCGLRAGPPRLRGHDCRRGDGARVLSLSGDAGAYRAVAAPRDCVCTGSPWCRNSTVSLIRHLLFSAGHCTFCSAPVDPSSSTIRVCVPICIPHSRARGSSFGQAVVAIARLHSSRSVSFARGGRGPAIPAGETVGGGDLRAPAASISIRASPGFPFRAELQRPALGLSRVGCRLKNLDDFLMAASRTRRRSGRIYDLIASGDFCRPARRP